MNPTEYRPASSNPVNPDAWVERHADYLFNYAIGQVREETIAEDLVQDTLLAAVRGQDKFAGQSSERTWLTGILRHKILDHLRRKRSRPMVSYLTADEEAGAGVTDDTLLWLHETIDQCASPSRRLELAEFREALSQALGTLPPRMAQAFELYELQEVPSEAICSELGISPNNLWVLLHRARRQLRRVLEEFGTGHHSGALALRS
jgi:RNA polymerase sigma-70 factor (ECF subfamily)